MKNELIKVRVSEEEKEKVNLLVKILGYKNVSEFIRNYINEMYEIYEETTMDGFTLLEFLHEYRKQYEFGIASRTMNDYELRKLAKKIELLREIMKEKGL